MSQASKTTHKTHNAIKPPTIKQACDFLARYASALLSNGAYTARIIKCTDRIGKAWGYEVHLTVFLKYIIVNITDCANYDSRRTQVIKNAPLILNLALISNLSALSWQIHDECLSLSQAQKSFEYHLSKKRLSAVLGVFVISLGNAAFCRLFGGDLGALVCIFAGTFVGILVRHFCHKIKLDSRAQYMLCAFLVSFTAYIGVWLGLSSTPDIAIAGSILYLIPGALIINAFVDIIHENTLMGISRTINMAVAMTCLAAGVFITLGIAKINIL